MASAHATAARTRAAAAHPSWTRRPARAHAAAFALSVSACAARAFATEPFTADHEWRRGRAARSAAAAAAAPPPSTAKLCVVCDDAPADYALLMCGHRCLCGDCVKHFQPGGGRECPMCRQPIERTMRIYDN